MAEFAVVAGVGAAVVLGWGCATALADESSGSSESASSGSASSDSASSESSESSDHGEPDVTSGGSDKDSTDEAVYDDGDDDPDATPDVDLDGEDPVSDDVAEDDEVSEYDEVGEDGEDGQEGEETTRVLLGDSPEATTGGAPPAAPPTAPDALPQAWVMTAAARRELEPEAPPPALPAARAQAPEPAGGEDEDSAENSIVYTAEPTLIDALTAATSQLVEGISALVGVDLHALVVNATASDRPPSWLTRGLQVHRTEYAVSDDENWQVWEIRPLNPTGRVVIAVHGGATGRPTMLHWLDYTSMARDTGATVIVPLYRVSAAGTESTLAPAMSRFVSDRIAEYGAENLSLHADSTGASLALSAMRRLVLDGRAVPAHMVLLSPDADVAAAVQDVALAALPPTTLYVGSLEEDVTKILDLQQKWSAAGGVVSVVVGQGQVRNWALAGSPNSQTDEIRPDLYRRLGLNDVAVGPRTITTGPPTYSDQLVADTLRFLRWFSETTGISLFSGVVGNVTSTEPPPIATLGLTVTASEFNGWTVWELAAPEPSGEYVVALHGGGFAAEANILHWSDYGQMARDTGATVLVPIYPLAPPLGTGTATTLVPPMADYLTQLIDEHGVDNVSVYGDSSGGSFAVLAVQELIRRCRADVACVTTESQPSRMVLVSPALHITLRSPEVEAIDDPILPRWDPDEIPGYNGELDMDDYRVNPISSDDLTGLPPTALYIGTQEQLYPGALAFRDKLLAQDPDADFTVIVGDGQLHGWALGGLVINSQAPIWRATVYRQLGLLPEVNSARTAPPAVV